MALDIQSQIDGFVLAGGASSRMGRPKSGVVLGGVTLLQRAVDTMSSFSGETAKVVVSPELADVLAGEGAELICDLPLSGREGSRAPILGIRTALSDSTAEWIAILAVDLPFVSAGLFHVLAAKAADGLDVVVPQQPDGSLQPLCALYRRETVLPAVESAILGDDISLRGMIAGLKARIVADDEFAELPGVKNFFVNVNTPDDLARAELLLT